MVNVSDEGFDLYDGLGGFLDDTIDFEGKKAKMEVSLLELPPILQIQLQVRFDVFTFVSDWYSYTSSFQRVQFDRQTLQPKKNNAYVKFNESLFMDRFMEDAPSDKKQKSSSIQAELQRCRDRITTLVQAPVRDLLGLLW